MLLLNCSRFNVVKIVCFDMITRSSSYAILIMITFLLCCIRIEEYQVMAFGNKLIVIRLENSSVFVNITSSYHMIFIRNNRMHGFVSCIFK